MSPDESADLFEHAESAGLTILEAYMWPHHRRARALLQLAADGSLGTLHTGRSSFSYPMDMSKGDHRIDTRGAGAVFDIGIYCIAPFLMMADRDPVGMAANATRNDLGVDIMMAGWIDWGQGFSSAFDVSFDVPLRKQMALSGSLGLATFQANMYRVPHARVRSRSSGATVRSTPSPATERMCMPGWCRISKQLPEGSGADLRQGREPALGRDPRRIASPHQGVTSAARWAGFSRRRDVGGWAGAGAAGRDELRAQRAAAVQFDRQRGRALEPAAVALPVARRTTSRLSRVGSTPAPTASISRRSSRSVSRALFRPVSATPTPATTAAGIARSTKGVAEPLPITAPVIPPMATTVPPPPANRRLVVRSTVIRTTDQPFPVSWAVASTRSESPSLPSPVVLRMVRTVTPTKPERLLHSPCPDRSTSRRR